MPQALWTPNCKSWWGRTQLRNYCRKRMHGWESLISPRTCGAKNCQTRPSNSIWMTMMSFKSRTQRLSWIKMLSLMIRRELSVIIIRVEMRSSSHLPERKWQMVHRKRKSVTLRYLKEHRSLQMSSMMTTWSTRQMKSPRWRKSTTARWECQSRPNLCLKTWTICARLLKCLPILVMALAGEH